MRTYTTGKVMLQAAQTYALFTKDVFDKMVMSLATHTYAKRTCLKHTTGKVMPQAAQTHTLTTYLRHIQQVK